MIYEALLSIETSCKKLLSSASLLFFIISSSIIHTMYHHSFSFNFFFEFVGGFFLYAFANFVIFRQHCMIDMYTVFMCCVLVHIQQIDVAQEILSL